MGSIGALMDTLFEGFIDQSSFVYVLIIYTSDKNDIQYMYHYFIQTQADLLNPKKIGSPF